ncbi:uncharacterized protein PG986_000587 [Apiospora aurea]|uniref:Rhodopsin domain-containing protein n=1 Tax=Apiospora aurea TaxID=335848 RepID=A0ABR1QUE5_9PEZI
MHNPFWIRSFVARRYDEAVAKAAYLQHMAEVADTQDLSEDIRGRARWLTVGFTLFATIVVAMRFIARRRQGAKLLIDDWLTVVTLVLCYGNMAMNMILIDQGVGLHTGALSLPQLQKLNEVSGIQQTPKPALKDSPEADIISTKTLVGAEILYCTGVNMYKIALLYLYFRLFPTRDIRLGSYILGGVSCAWNVACVFAAAFQCLPREKLWQPWLPGGCIDLFLTQLAISVPCMLLDVAILCLPMRHVWNLKTNLTQRVCLTVIFLLGSYVVFTSVYRFVIFLQYNNDDNSFTLGDGIAWNVIEIASGIISGCLPTLGPLVRIVFKAVSPSALRSRGLSGNKLGGGNSSSYAKKSGGVATIGGGGGSSHARHSRPLDAFDDGKYGVIDDDNDAALYGSRSRGSGSRAFDGARRTNVSVTVAHNRDDSGDGSHVGFASSHDEIPLTAIGKETHVEWSYETASQHGNRTRPGEAV